MSLFQRKTSMRLIQLLLQNSKTHTIISLPSQINHMMNFSPAISIHWNRMRVRWKTNGTQTCLLFGEKCINSPHLCVNKLKTRTHVVHSENWTCQNRHWRVNKIRTTHETWMVFVSGVNIYESSKCNWTRKFSKKHSDYLWISSATFFIASCTAFIVPRRLQIVFELEIFVFRHHKDVRQLNCKRGISVSNFDFWGELTQTFGDFLLIEIDMGMITRVRGRLRSFHNIHKLDPEERDEKIAETGKYTINKTVVCWLFWVEVVNSRTTLDQNDPTKSNRRYFSHIKRNSQTENVAV